MRSERRIRLLIVDDSAVVRQLLTRSLAFAPDIEVVGTASDPYAAREAILSLRPDVLTLDIEMPRMNGLTFLEKLMQHHPLPVVVISSQASPATALSATRLGAVDVIAKPSGRYSIDDLGQTLARTVRAAAACRLPAASQGPTSAGVLRYAHGRFRCIAIGASTGGTEAIRRLLVRLPANSPPVLIAQHIPAGFSRSFAESLDEICQLAVSEASDGDVLTPGRAMVAPGGLHMQIARDGETMRIVLRDGPRVCYQKPSVDVLFASVAAETGSHAAGILLTGMGSDGATGLLQMKNSGALTIAQDEASCVVFGMPAEAIRRGAVEHVLPLDRIAQAVLGNLTKAEG